MADQSPPPPRPVPPANEDGRHDIVVVGASAGGVEALVQLVRDLPPDLPASVLVVLHVLSTGTSVLHDLLDRAGPLPAAPARDNEKLTPGRIYVAPPDHHLVVQPGHVELSRGPRENGHRPSVDVLFRTAAWAYGSRVLAVVLSGTRDDGTSGLRHVKSLGGVAVAQDPQEALYPGMPRSAIANVNVDWIAPVAGIAPLLTRLVHQGEPAHAIGSVADPPPTPGPVAGGDDATGLICPDCGGALWQVREGNLVRLQCRVGHSFSPESLLVEQADMLESALWAALRTLDERAELLRRMAARARGEHGESRSAESFEAQAADATQRAELIRQAIMQAPAAPADAATAQPAEVAPGRVEDGAGTG